MKIGYLTFGRDDFGYGMALVLSRLEEHEVYRVTPKTAKLVDVLLFSVFWWEHFFNLADFLRTAGISKNQPARPRIIVGGFATFNPVPLLAYADAVVVGDGEDVVAAVVQGDYSAMSVLTADKTGVKWGCAESIAPFTHETNGITRCEIARGCKNRCAFCAVAHLKKYREVPYENLKAVMPKMRKKRVSFFAPNTVSYSSYADLGNDCKRFGIARLESDVRLDYLESYDGQVPKIGLEGISERLRKSVRKPYADQAVIDGIKVCMRKGYRAIFWMLILDLPGETDEDWDSFRQLLIDVDRIPGIEDFVLKPSPSVFMPTPHTPMGGAAIHWDRDYGGKWERFFGRGEDRKWKVMMAERSRVFGPCMRLLQMMATRAGKEFAATESALSAKRIIGLTQGRVRVIDQPALIAELAKGDLIGAYCGERTSGPWDIVTL